MCRPGFPGRASLILETSAEGPENASERGEMRRVLAMTAALVVGSATAATAAVGGPVSGSGGSPFGPGCNGAVQDGTTYRGSELEPFVSIDPLDPRRMVGVYQQDRISTGGANGQGVTVSTDGGVTWTQTPASSWPKFSRCNGAAPGSAGDWERATDPWVSFGPDGRAYQISLGFNDTRDLANAVLASTSEDGGRTWSPVATLQKDTSPTLFNDKESITADPTRPGTAYAVWDRLEYPSARSKGRSYLTAAAYRGPTLFTRTTDGGRTWSPTRTIFDPGRNDQTIANQIAVLPDGDLLNLMTVLRNDNGGGKRRGAFVSLIRSTDGGATWSSEVPIARLGAIGVTDPDDGAPVRTGDVIPDIAVHGQDVYVVWQDARYTGFAREQIAFAHSADGGRTWSAPVRLSPDLTTQAFNAAVSTDASGNVGVTFDDFRNDRADTAGLSTDHWFLRSTDQGRTWSQERVTPTSFDLRTAPVARGYFLGDYAGLDSSGDTFTSYFSQSRSTGTDTFGANLREPFPAATLTPDPTEAAGVPASAFPVAKGRPAPA
jgi:hypothetical protein